MKLMDSVLGADMIPISDSIAGPGSGFGTLAPAHRWRYLVAQLKLSPTVGSDAEARFGFGIGSNARFIAISATGIRQFPLTVMIPPGTSLIATNQIDPNVANVINPSQVFAMVPRVTRKSRFTPRLVVGKRGNLGSGITSRVNGLDRLVIDYVSVLHSPTGGAAGTCALTLNVGGVAYTPFTSSIAAAHDPAEFPFMVPLPPGGSWSIALTNATSQQVYEQEWM